MLIHQPEMLIHQPQLWWINTTLVDQHTIMVDQHAIMVGSTHIVNYGWINTHCHCCVLIHESCVLIQP